MNALVAKFQETIEGAGEPEANIGSFQQISALLNIFSPKEAEGKGLLYADSAVNEKVAILMLDTGATHSFIDVWEASRLGLNLIKGHGTIKAVNLEAKPVVGSAKDVLIKIGHWQRTFDFTIVPMDDYKIVIDLSFFQKALAFLVPTSNSLVTHDDRKLRVSS